MTSDERSRYREAARRALVERIGIKVWEHLRKPTTQARVVTEAISNSPSAPPNTPVLVHYGPQRFPCTYEMRWVRSSPPARDIDLAEIAWLSETDPAIQGANEELEHDKRVELYQRWHQACPRGFLLLKEVCHCRDCRLWADPKERELLVAATIVLPLRPIYNADPLICRQRVQATDLRAEDISNTATNHVLLDTLVTRYGFKNHLAGFQWSLLLQHVHELLPGLSQRDEGITFWIEPDEPKGVFDVVCELVKDRKTGTRSGKTWTYARTIVPTKIVEQMATASSHKGMLQLWCLNTLLRKIDSMSFVIT